MELRNPKMIQIKFSVFSVRLVFSVSNRENAVTLKKCLYHFLPVRIDLVFHVTIKPTASVCAFRTSRQIHRYLASSLLKYTNLHNSNDLR
jgi:hypothetical protein